MDNSNGRISNMIGSYFALLAKHIFVGRGTTAWLARYKYGLPMEQAHFSILQSLPVKTEHRRISCIGWLAAHNVVSSCVGETRDFGGPG